MATIAAFYFHFILLLFYFILFLAMRPKTKQHRDRQTDKHTDHAATATIGRIVFFILFYF